MNLDFGRKQQNRIAPSSIEDNYDSEDYDSEELEEVMNFESRK